ncbi:hypothetical protein IJ182_00560 [bacterium]|nr:hypothetical protein [bacterium]
MKITPVDRNQVLNKTNNIQRKNTNTPSNSFNGAGDAAFNVLDKAFSVLDKNAMIQVSFVDTVSTNIPRTLVDLKTGLAAAFETCRREFSGLFVNCLMPGLVVKALAAMLPKSEQLKNTDVVGSWANGSSIDKLKGVYKEAQTSGAADTTKDFVEKAIGALEGLDGKSWVKYADKAQEPVYQSAITDVTQAIGKTGKERKTLLKQAQAKLAGLTKAESVLKFNGQPQANLEETLRDVADLGSKFNVVKDKTIAKVGADSKDVTAKVAEAVDKYSSSLTKFVNKKSLIGMAIVVGIAVSIQTINRAITRKQFKAEGAPIYKDFGKKDTTQKMDDKQKKKFFGKKLLSAAGMYGLAAASMMKKPTLGMFQFSGIFPTMDQCRWIAASTFASRMMGAEDENELRESTVRDIASFSGLYFLGDYVKKGVASGIEKLSQTKKGAQLLGENVVLLNRKKEVAKPIIEEGASAAKKLASNVAYRAKQFGNWIKNTDLKTAAEVSSTKVRNMRNICRVADIAFSVLMLGVLLPKYNRSVTEKKVAAAKLEEEKQKRAMFDISNLKNVPNVFKNLMKE